MIDLSVGTKVKYKDKHGIIALSDESWDNKCDYCILSNRNSECANAFACLESERSDYSDIYVKEVLTNKGK